MLLLLPSTEPVMHGWREHVSDDVSRCDVLTWADFYTYPILNQPSVMLVKNSIVRLPSRATTRESVHPIIQRSQRSKHDDDVAKSSRRQNHSWCLGEWAGLRSTPCQSPRTVRDRVSGWKLELPLKSRPSDPLRFQKHLFTCGQGLKSGYAQWCPIHKTTKQKKPDFRSAARTTVVTFNRV